MTPDIEALVARLERDSDTDDVFSKAAYALRRQAREIERLTQENSVIAGHLGLDKLVEQRDALQARVRALEDELGKASDTLSMMDSAIGTDGRTIRELRAELEIEKKTNARWRELAYGEKKP